MPVAADPTQTAPYVLAQHRTLPEAERPTFRLRFLTVRQARDMSRLFREAMDAGDDDAYLSKLLEAAQIAVVGWERFDVEYDPDQLDAIVTTMDLIELCRDGPLAVSMAEGEAKKSAWQSESSSGESAPAASPESASTNPTD